LEQTLETSGKMLIEFWGGAWGAGGVSNLVPCNSDLITEIET